MRFTRLVLAMLPVWAGTPAALGDQHTRPPAPDLYLTLPETISLAIRNNRGLINSRLDRAIQKFALEVAEDEFRPDASIGPSVRFDSSGDWDGRAEIRSDVSLRVPTGGKFVVSWYDTDLSEVRFTQPLLKGGGIAVNTASLKAARLQEELNILALKAAVGSTVTSVIRAYRGYVQAGRRLEIHTRSLQRAKELLATTRVLIAAGRLAERDIVQPEADVARRELGLTEARDSVDAARLALIDILDIDSRTRIHPTETLNVDSVEADIDREMETALRHRPDYRQALLQVERDETELLVARNNRLWDLSATYSTRFADTGDSRSVELNLNIPFGDLSPKQRYMQADIALRKARNQLAELRQKIDIEVRDALRKVDVRFRQIELARRTRDLAERKYEIEKGKLGLGLSTNFRVAAFEDDLVSAQNREVETAIAYLNALTDLDRTLGTTLQRWQIDIERIAE